MRYEFESYVISDFRKDEMHGNNKFCDTDLADLKHIL